MKSKVNINKTVKRIPYPKMMRGVLYRDIVLFSSESEGVLIHKGKRESYIGRISKIWRSDQNWEDLTPGESVTLTQTAGGDA